MNEYVVIDPSSAEMNDYVDWLTSVSGKHQEREWPETLMQAILITHRLKSMLCKLGYSELEQPSTMERYKSPSLIFSIRMKKLVACMGRKVMRVISMYVCESTDRLHIDITKNF
jgi:hypothetical protein